MKEILKNRRSVCFMIEKMLPHENKVGCPLLEPRYREGGGIEGGKEPHGENYPRKGDGPALIHPHSTP